MALARTDTAHQIDFQRQAEAHRRGIVGALNGDMIRNAGAADFDYRAAGRPLAAASYGALPRFAASPGPAPRIASIGWVLLLSLATAAWAVVRLERVRPL